MGPHARLLRRALSSARQCQAAQASALRVADPRCALPLAPPAAQPKQIKKTDNFKQAQELSEKIKVGARRAGIRERAIDKKAACVQGHSAACAPSGRSPLACSYTRPMNADARAANQSVVSERQG